MHHQHICSHQERWASQMNGTIQGNEESVQFRSKSPQTGLFFQQALRRWYSLKPKKRRTQPTFVSDVRSPSDNDSPTNKRLPVNSCQRETFVYSKFPLKPSPKMYTKKISYWDLVVAMEINAKCTPLVVSVARTLNASNLFNYNF